MVCLLAAIWRSEAWLWLLIVRGRRATLLLEPKFLRIATLGTIPDPHCFGLAIEHVSHPVRTRKHPLPRLVVLVAVEDVAAEHRLDLCNKSSIVQRANLPVKGQIRNLTRRISRLFRFSKIIRDSRNWSQ